jgi:hypothetical protein
MNTRLLVALGLAVVSVVGCSSGPTIPSSPTPSPLPTVPPASASPNPFSSGHYDDGNITFDFPADWNAARGYYPSSVSDLKAYLSTEPLREPCVPSGDATLCRAPIEGLQPGGVLVSWWRWGLHRGDPGPDPNTGELIHVGGRSGRMHDSGAEGHCLNIDSDKAMRLEIPDPTLDGSWTVMDACLREPVDDAQAQLNAMLASVTWLSPQPTRVVHLGDSDQTVALFDDTGLVTDAIFEMGAPGEGAFATPTGIIVIWGGPTFCGQQPIVGLARDSQKLLVLVEPLAGLDHEIGQECDVWGEFSLKLTLSEPVEQDDISLEVW